MEAIHAVNAVLWQPGEQTHVSQTNKQTKQTDRLLYPWSPTRASTDYYTRGRPRVPQVIIILFNCTISNNYMYRIAGNFRVSILLVSSWFIYSWMLLALQVKVGKVTSFVGKIFGPVFNHEYFAPRKSPAIYGT